MKLKHVGNQSCKGTSSLSGTVLGFWPQEIREECETEVSNMGWERKAVRRGKVSGQQCCSPHAHTIAHHQGELSSPPATNFQRYQSKRAGMSR